MCKYIFLTGYYLPKPGATGLCIHQLAKEAVKRGYDVTTICYADGSQERSIDGIKVIKVNIPAFLQKNTGVSTLRRYINNIFSVSYKLLHICKYPLKSSKIVASYCNEICKLLKNEEHPVTVIASLNPLEAVLAAYNVKEKYKKNVKIIFYCADTLSNERGREGILPLWFRIYQGYKWEKKLFRCYDKILIMQGMKDYYFSLRFKHFRNKMIIVNFPFISSDLYYSQENDKCNFNSHITFVYAGTLYRKLRNPQTLCNLLCKIADRVDLEAFFMGLNHCSDIMKSAEKNSKGKIKHIGIQSHENVLHFMRKADVLMNIGNAESPMMPSKIYEYMSTGKPIIHIYTYDEDPCIIPLKAYGNAFLIKDGEKVDLPSLLSFLEKRKRIPFETVKNTFYFSTPEYSFDVIEE